MATKTKRKRSTTKKPEEVFEVNTDILRLGKTFYAIKRIESKEIDIDAELKQLYKQRHDRHIDTLNKGIVETVRKDWSGQIEHLNKYEGRNSAIIPEKFFGCAVMWHERLRTLMLLRQITYAPNIVQGARDYFAAFPEMLSGIPVPPPNVNERTTLFAYIKPPFSVPLLVGYDERSKKLYTPFQQTFHTHGGGDVCTGRHGGEAFWKLSDADLEAEMNKVNLMSPANSAPTINGTQYAIRDLYRPGQVIRISGREDIVWNVSRLSTSLDSNS